MNDSPNSPNRLNFRSKLKQDFQSKYKYAPKAPKTDIEKLLAKAVDLKGKVQQQIQPILQAGGGFDKDSLRATIFTLYLQAFDSKLFSKEELVNLCTILYSELLMESIETDPGGTGTPDLLS